MKNDKEKQKNQNTKTGISVIEKICGSMKGYLSSSEEFAKQKQIEIELETQKFERCISYSTKDK